MLYSQGDRSSAFYLVESGTVEMSITPATEPADGDEPPSPEEAPTSPAPAEKLQHADPRSMSRKQRSSTLGASLPVLS